MARLIDADRLKEVFHRNIANGEVFDDLIANAPTVDAIPREKIDEMIAEIEKSMWIDKDTRIVKNCNASGLNVALQIIHKYCDNSQVNNS